MKKFKQYTVAAVLAVTAFIGGAAINASAMLPANSIESKGRLESNGGVVLDASDFSVLKESDEIGKAEAYNLGYSVGYEEGKASVNLKDIVNNYDSITISNVSYGIGTTNLAEGLYYLHGSFGNWTSNWGGRVADITTNQYIIDSEGKILAQFCNGTYEGDYCRGHSFPYQLVYCPEGSKLIITAKVTHDNGASSSVSGTMVSFK